MSSHSPPSLQGAQVLITRPAGTGQALARKVRARGGQPRLLPGMALRALPEDAARRSLEAARAMDDVLIFTSPAAVRFAARLGPLTTPARVLAVGHGTLRALHRAGVQVAQAPPRDRQHSEGLLAHPALQQLAGRSVALVTAPGGRGRLDAELRRRGATLRAVHVYTRKPPRMTRRHHAMLAALGSDAWLLVTSAQAMHGLLDALPELPRRRLLGCRIVVSSARLAALARQAGFAQPVCAASAQAHDLLVALAAARAAS